MERGPCYGFCAIYGLEIFKDGVVMFNGRGYVAKKGVHSGSISRASIERLKRSIEESGVEGLKNDCCNCYDMSDAPSTTLTISDGINSKTIKHYHGCLRAPKALQQLEQTIDELSGDIQWIGTLDDREAHRWYR